MRYGDDSLVSSALDSVGANGDRVMSLAVDQSVKTDIYLSTLSTGTHMELVLVA